MLQKSTSKKIWQLKYLLLIPLITVMLFYTSCEAEQQSELDQTKVSLEDQVRELEASIAGEDVSPDLQRRLLNVAAQANNISLGDFPNKQANTDQPFTTVNVKPSFKSPCAAGTSDFNCFKVKLDQHVRHTFQYPKQAIAKKVEGRVYVNFRINRDGTISILGSRAPDPLLDAEARRIISSLPELNPGLDKDGNPVSVLFAYPIAFRLK